VKGVFYVVSLRTSNWAYLSGNKVYLPVSALNLSNWLVHPARGAGVTLRIGVYCALRQPDGQGQAAYAPFKGSI
jgi:hypothetical protein